MENPDFNLSSQPFLRQKYFSIPLHFPLFFSLWREKYTPKALAFPLVSTGIKSGISPAHLLSFYLRFYLKLLALAFLSCGSSYLQLSSLISSAQIWFLVSFCVVELLWAEVCSVCYDLARGFWVNCSLSRVLILGLFEVLVFCTWWNVGADMMGFWRIDMGLGFPMQWVAIFKCSLGSRV